MTTETLAKAIDPILEAATKVMEAARNKRKDTDLKQHYSDTHRNAKVMFREQKRTFMNEFKRMATDFREARNGPTKAKVDKAWGKAEKRGKNLIKAIDRNSREAVRKGAKSAMVDLSAAEYGISFNLQDPLAQKFLKDNGVKKVKGINKTTRGRIQTVLNKAAKEGWSYKQTAEEIAAIFDSSVTVTSGSVISRAELIAVTEMGEAYEAGRQAVLDKFDKAGLDTEKMWITVGDEKVCTVCAPNGSAGWIKGKDAFPSGHDRPLGHPACRCDMGVRVVT